MVYSHMFLRIIIIIIIITTTTTKFIIIIISLSVPTNGLMPSRIYSTECDPPLSAFNDFPTPLSIIIKGINYRGVSSWRGFLIDLHNRIFFPLSQFNPYHAIGFHRWTHQWVNTCCADGLTLGDLNESDYKYCLRKFYEK